MSVLLALIWKAGLNWLSILTLVPFLIALWLFVAFFVRNTLQRHFFSLANVIESLRAGDYNMRVAPQKEESAWSDVYRELNQLASDSQQSQTDGLEANILLDKLLAEFGIPVFVFDRHQKLSNINNKGCELFAKDRGKLLGLTPEQMHLQPLLNKNSGDVIEHWFPERGGRWELRKNYFMQQGQRFMLVLVNDLSQTLREEERTAWQRLIRVLGHELNNSLASLTSVSETLLKRLPEEKTEKWYASYDRALSLINERSHSLLRFTEAYTRLAKLPPPSKTATDVQTLFHSLTGLVEGNFVFRQSQSLLIQADRDQMQQLFINLLKNAVEASSQETEVEIAWQQHRQGTLIQVIDNGIGLPTSDNLFVPFYTTKENGNGIGLFLCRQIAEAHNGTLRLINRNDKQGCIAECWLPS